MLAHRGAVVNPESHDETPSAGWPGTGEGHRQGRKLMQHKLGTAAPSVGYTLGVHAPPALKSGGRLLDSRRIDT